MKKEITTVHMMVGDQEIIVDGYVHYTVETNYGADADGKRGIKRVEVEDVTDVEALDLDGNDYILNEANKDRAIDALTIQFLES